MTDTSLPVKNLDFDIPNRKLTVFHTNEIEPIEQAILALNLGGKKISTEKTNITAFEENTNQKKVPFRPGRLDAGRGCGTCAVGGAGGW